MNKDQDIYVNISVYVIVYIETMTFEVDAIWSQLIEYCISYSFMLLVIWNNMIQLSSSVYIHNGIQWKLKKAVLALNKALNKAK